VYRSALQDPTHLYIGIDPNRRPLEKISEKIYRKPAKGGAPNAIYLLASAENLPEELNGIGDEVFVLFPWGTLLRYVLTCDEAVISGMKRVSKSGASVQIVFSVDPESDQSEMRRLELPQITEHYAREILPLKYVNAGFEIVEARQLRNDEFESLSSSWAKRLAQNPRRIVYQILTRSSGFR